MPAAKITPVGVKTVSPKSSPLKAGVYYAPEPTEASSYSPMEPSAQTQTVTKIRVAEFPRKGKPIEHDAARAAELKAHNSGFVWIHIVAGDKETAANFMRDELGFHPLEVEDSLSETERPALVERPGILFMVCVAVEERGSREHFHEVALFVGRGFIASVVLQEDDQVNRLFDHYLSSELDKDESESRVLYKVLDHVVDDYFPALDVIERDISALEEAVFHGDRMKLKSALRVKRRLLELRRHLTPVRDELNMLLRRDSGIIPNKLKPYFQDIYDHTLRLIESVDLERDILATLMDAHLSIVSNRLNEVMRAMTVLATLLMSAGLIAGIYGMNFHTMPELDWKLGYPFAIGLMVIVSLLELRWFRKKGWL